MHSDLHGSSEEFGNYNSDLIELINTFNPRTQVLDTITGYLNKDGTLGGMQLMLADKNDGRKRTEMQKIGDGVRQNKIALMGGKINMISIIEEEDRVCDVVFGTEDGSFTSLSLDKSGECNIENGDNDNVMATVLQVTDEYPLVGLHGIYSEEMKAIEDLGIIWLDTKTPKCRRADPNLKEKKLDMTPLEAYLSLTNEQ